MGKIIKSKSKWRAQLTDLEFNVCRQKGTERAFTGKYNSCKDEGIYACICCGNHLFKSDTKFDSGTGWPSFYAPISDQVVADSNKARLLFETGLPTRYYLPRDDVHLDLLQPSDRSTSCPYKGTANYWHVKLGNEVFKDLVWSYPDPAPEAAQIKGYFCFFNEQVGAIHIDGVKTERPVSKWSPK